MIFCLNHLEFVKLVNSGTNPYFRKKASEDVVEVVVFSANTFFIKVHARFLCFISENYA